jgi:hypothetical protein
MLEGDDAPRSLRDRAVGLLRSVAAYQLRRLRAVSLEYHTRLRRKTSRSLCLAILPLSSRGNDVTNSIRLGIFKRTILLAKKPVNLLLSGKRHDEARRCFDIRAVVICATRRPCWMGRFDFGPRQDAAIEAVPVLRREPVPFDQVGLRSQPQPTHFKSEETFSISADSAL